jgi:hypothetical protein
MRFNIFLKENINIIPLFVCFHGNSNFRCYTDTNNYLQFLVIVMFSFHRRTLCLLCLILKGLSVILPHLLGARIRNVCLCIRLFITSALRRSQLSSWIAQNGRHISWLLCYTSLKGLFMSTVHFTILKRMLYIHEIPVRNVNLHTGYVNTRWSWPSSKQILEWHLKISHDLVLRHPSHFTLHMHTFNRRF